MYIVHYTLLSDGVKEVTCHHYSVTSLFLGVLYIFSAKCAIFSYFFRKLLLFFTKNIVFGGFLPVFCIFRHISVEIVQQRCI